MQKKFLFGFFYRFIGEKKFWPTKLYRFNRFFLSKILYLYRFNQYIFEYRCPPLVTFKLIDCSMVIKSQRCDPEPILSELDPDPASQKELQIEPCGMKRKKIVQFMQLRTLSSHKIRR